jgi:hypothetical protein
MDFGVGWRFAGFEHANEPNPRRLAAEQLNSVSQTRQAVALDLHRFCQRLLERRAVRCVRITRRWRSCFCGRGSGFFRRAFAACFSGFAFFCSFAFRWRCLSNRSRGGR